MATMNQFLQAAQGAGFVRNTCVHDNHEQHVVRDYPEALKGETSKPLWRVHIDISRRPVVAYIGGSDTPQQRVSLKNAIDFVQRVARDHPKD